MKKNLLTLMISAILSFGILIAQSASAITLGFQPEVQNTALGDSVTVDLIISDLGDYMPDSLSTFDITILFDSMILSVDTADIDNDGVIDSVSLDPSSQLDIYGFGLNVLSASVTSPGTLNIYDLSFDTEDDLNNYQKGNFSLATITFDTIGVGTSELLIDSATIQLGDATGNPLVATLNSGFVTVAASVPEPATCLFMGVGLVGLLGLKKKKF